MGNMMGVLKRSSPTSVIATAGLAIALVPLGVRSFREPPRPRARDVSKWGLLIAALIGAMFYVGRLG
jgi:drug/metabolite transporter (DMT)-like permease